MQFRFQTRVESSILIDRIADFKVLTAHNLVTKLHGDFVQVAGAIKQN